jgi:hypothetical protein
VVVIEIQVSFDELYRQLAQAQTVLLNLTVDLSSIQLRPTDPQDVERTTLEMERQIDLKFEAYRSNPFIEPIANETKRIIREWVSHRVEEALRNASRSIEGPQ